VIKYQMVLVVVMAAIGGPAVAKPEAGPKVEARRHYDAGMAHFNLREYKLAIDEFQAAYRLRPEPVLLYNLGQAYRLAEDTEQALYFYRAYLRNDPQAANRADVEARIAVLEATLEQKRAAAKPAPTPVPAPAALAPAPTPTVAASAATGHVADRAQTPLYRRWWLWTIVGVVAVGAGVGVAVGVTMQKSPSFEANLGTVGPSSLAVRF
jgi:tetratricopeptide (TPR) repeat protein